MPRRRSRQAPDRLRPPAPRLLLAPALRPFAAALLAACVAVTTALGAWFTHQSRPGWLDAAVDARIRAGLGGHPGLLDDMAGLGNPLPVTVMIAALALTCLVTRRARGAALVAVAVPAAASLTELLLKPLVGRRMQGALSLPSGHSTGMFALAGACAVLLGGPSGPRGRAVARLLLALTAYLAACAVAVALIGLGVHYFTDTVAGAAVGTAVVLATAFVLDRLGQPGYLAATGGLSGRTQPGQVGGPAGRPPPAPAGPAWAVAAPGVAGQRPAWRAQNAGPGLGCRVPGTQL
jgi:membrane-associated phospholipid phosphatase